MFISHLLATSWIVFSVGQSVHDDFETRRRLSYPPSSGNSYPDQSHKSEVGTNVWVGDDENFCSGFNCGPNCWRPFFCKLDTKTCNGETLRRCGAQCRFPRCPDPVCPTDVKECPDGTILNRDPATCNFPSCPTPPSCSPSLGFRTCPDGSRVGRDPNNLCITWLPCPTAFTCANGWQKIPMNQVCNGRRVCNDGSDEWPSHGCQQFTIGGRRRSEEETLELESDVDQLDSPAQRRLRVPPTTYNCFSGGSPSRWTVGKQRWCCSNYNRGCQSSGGIRIPGYLPTPEPYNCYTRESWSSQKRRWCCSNKGLGCRSSESEYTPGGEYNCNYGRPSSWTRQKSRFCCRTQGRGCTSGGPTIGG